MDIENQEVFCGVDADYRVYCDKVGNEQFLKNHLESQTHTNNIRKKRTIKYI